MNWDYARTPRDAGDLAAFVCTEPIPILGTDADDVLGIENEYEYEVEIALQEAPIPPPTGDFILIGRDDEPGIAAACWWSETAGPRYVRLYAIARALRTRGRGYGDAILDEFKSRLRDNAADMLGEVIMVQARVDRSNAESQALLERHEFNYANNDGWYQRWWLRLPNP